MTPEQIAKGMRRELLKNILIAPIILFIRLPIGLVYAVLSGLIEAIERLGDYIPGWRFDYFNAFKKQRRDSENQATLLPESTDND